MTARGRLPKVTSFMQAKEAILATEELIDKALASLAERVREGKAVSVEKLDQHQAAAYDLAWICAQLQAGRCALEFAQKNPGDLESNLADFFIADALSAISTTIIYRLGEFGITREDLERSLMSESACSWIETKLSPPNIGLVASLLRHQGGLVNYGLSHDHLEIKNLFKKFADTKIVPIAEQIHRQDADIPEEVIRSLAELGCFGLSVPQRYEGFQDDNSPDNLGMVIATEELSRASLGAAGSLITRPEILAKALLKGGTEEQKNKWLPLIATGRKMVSVAVTEPDYGSDVASIVVKATPADGGGWVISGTKLWCTFAGRAEVLMVLARTDPDKAKKYKGLSVFIAEKPAFGGHHFEYAQPKGGKISGRSIPCIGYRGMHTFEVIFDNYRVPEENLIGGKEALGKGFYLQMEGFAGGRLQTAARANGVSQAAFESALNYARERKVFGKPIGEYQLTEWKLVRMAAWLHASRQLTYQVAKLFDQGQGQMEASLVKLFASRISEWIAREAVQIHGAMGYSDETPVSRYFLDAKVFSIFEGAEEILALRVIAKSLLEKILDSHSVIASPSRGVVI